MANKNSENVRVWDLPVRLFHWALVILMAVSYFSGEAGGDWMKLHFWSGYTILTLVLFRILWGFLGSTTARFSNFVRGPGAVFGHLREMLGRHGPHDVGHNPVGGLMVVALLFAVLLQAATGLFSADTDMGTVNGPLATKVADKVVEKATAFHHVWIKLILVMIALHVLAAIVYLIWKRQNLIRAMITGRKPRRDVTAEGKPVPALTFGSGRLAFSLLVASAAIVYFVVRLGG